MKKINLFKKIASVFMAFAMIMLFMPEVEAKADQAIVVSFKNTEGWSNVYAYAWDNTQATLLGSWPGTDISATESDGYYTAVLPEMEDDSVNIIFNGGQDQPQTVDLKIDLTQGLQWWAVPNGYEGTKVTCTVATSQADAEAGNAATTPTTPTTPTVPENSSVQTSPVIDGNKVTFYYECENAGSIVVACSMNNWSTTEWVMTKGDGNVYSYTCELEAGVYQYKFVVDGAWLADPVNPNTVDDGFGGANSSFEVTAGTDTTPENSTIKESPVVDGNTVTFYYESSTATKVEVFGSMNGWEAGFEMTKDGNVFSYTCELEAGFYQYKYVIDGVDWIMDPVNENTQDDGTGNLNSSFEVTASGTDTPVDSVPEDTLTENTSTEDASTEDTSTEDVSKEENDADAEEVDKDDANEETNSMPSGVIVLISAIVTIVIALGAFAGYVIYTKKKQA